MKILPNYFKTKNYSSFVRQLNLYSFSKIKNEDGFIEFSHDKFQRGEKNKLNTIKRKLTEYTDALETYKDGHDEMSKKYKALEQQLSEVNNSLTIIKNQNKRLVDTNKDLLLRLYSFKNDFEEKIKKILFSFYIVSHYRDEETCQKVKQLMQEGGINIELGELRNEQAINTLVKRLASELIFLKNPDNKLLDKIVTVLLNFINEKVAINQFDIDWQSIAKELFKEDNRHCPFSKSTKEGPKDVGSVEIIVPKFIKNNDKEYSIQSNNSFADGLSFMSRFNNHKDSQSMARFSDFNRRSNKSQSEHFIPSESDSFKAFSQQSDRDDDHLNF